MSSPDYSDLLLKAATSADLLETFTVPHCENCSARGTKAQRLLIEIILWLDTLRAVSLLQRPPLPDVPELQARARGIFRASPEALKDPDGSLGLLRALRAGLPEECQREYDGIRERAQGYHHQHRSMIKEVLEASEHGTPTRTTPEDWEILNTKGDEIRAAIAQLLATHHSAIADLIADIIESPTDLDFEVHLNPDLLVAE